MSTYIDIVKRVWPASCDCNVVGSLGCIVVEQCQHYQSLSVILKCHNCGRALLKIQTRGVGIWEFGYGISALSDSWISSIKTCGKALCFSFKICISSEHSSLFYAAEARFWQLQQDQRLQQGRNHPHTSSCLIAGQSNCWLDQSAQLISN